MSLLKHASTADGDYRLLYYRDIDKFEVDVVIENAAGELIGVESRQRPPSPSVICVA